MAVLLDTVDVPVQERRDALITTMRVAASAAEVVVPADEPVTARIDLWELGPATVFRADCTGLSLTRTARSTRHEDQESIALTVTMGGQLVRTMPDTGLNLVDLTRPLTCSWSGYGGTRTLNAPLRQLGLPLALVRRSVDLLPRSPLFALVRRHIIDLSRHADGLAGTAAAASVGAASIDLVRALVVTAAADEVAMARDVADDTLLVQVREYVRQRLRDPDLTPDSIAAALAVSPRQLYRICSAGGVRLEQLIIELRLENARAELANRTTYHRSIASTARRWGFTDPTHFTRRFRAAYGILPSEWRRLTAGADAQPALRGDAAAS